MLAFFFYFLNFFSKKVYFFMPKFWYIKKLLYLCHTIKHRIINLKLYRYEKFIRKPINYLI